MIVQFEDCADVAKMLHPELELTLLFNHSCGHDRQRPDGLSATKVNKAAGGVKPQIGKSKMETEELLGPFPAALEVGDCQQMVFQDGDSGPFCDSELERVRSSDRSQRKEDEEEGVDADRFESNRGERKRKQSGCRRTLQT